MLLSVMVAIGLFVFTFAIGRPLARRVPGTSLRPMSVAIVAASVLGVIAIPVYLDFATANDSLRSVFDLGALVPLFRVTAFGRGYVDMMLCFALFCVAAWISLWLHRGDLESRSVAELMSVTGALLAAAAVLMVPGAAGHAGQTSPRGSSLLFDWLHLTSGSLWLGGLIGLLVLWFAIRSDTRVLALSIVIPSSRRSGSCRYWRSWRAAPAQQSSTCRISMRCGKPGTASRSWSRLRSSPRRSCSPPGICCAPDHDSQARVSGPSVGEPAARLLRGLVGGEVFLLASAVFVSAVLSSLAPPPPAVALQDSALVQVGPGRVAETVKRAGYVLQILVSPNKVAVPDSFALRITKHGQPVRGASVTPTFNQPRCKCPSRNTSSPKPSPACTPGQRPR
jgi:copper transport protein